jgi:hypothetical protein
MVAILHDPDSPEGGPLCERCHSHVPNFRNLSDRELWEWRTRPAQRAKTFAKRIYNSRSSACYGSAYAHGSPTAVTP